MILNNYRKNDYTFILGHDELSDLICLWPKTKDNEDNAINLINWLEKNIIINKEKIVIDHIRINSHDTLLIIDYIRYLEKKVYENYDQ